MGLVWGILKTLFTAYHGSAAPTAPWRGTIAVFGEQMIWIYLEILAANLLDAKQFGIQRIIHQLGSCHGPACGAPAAGAGGGVPAGRAPRVNPPNLARRGEIVNKFKKDYKKLRLFIKGCT
jgi:hypothetical protein